MEIKELNEALEGLKNDLSAKTADEIKASLNEFEAKNKEAIDSLMDDMKVEFEKNLKEVQNHADKLDVKVQAATNISKGGVNDPIKNIIAKNFDEIKLVRKGKAINIQTKAVGTMTLPNNLTGDQPRDYSNTVARVPSQLINLADLVSTVTISGGTFTFPRETGSEGSIGTQAAEDTLKNQIDYDLTMIDVNTNFIAGFAVYSKKMANNLPFLESFLPTALRRDYWKSENSIFEGVLSGLATASSQVITGQNQIEMIVAEIATLEGLNYSPSAVVVNPKNFWEIMVMEKSTGAGYGLPGFVSYSGNVLRINGIPVYKATWMAADKYYVGDFSTIMKVVTQGLSVEFSSEDVDNFRKNNITSRIEAQVALGIQRPDAVIKGDFTAS